MKDEKTVASFATLADDSYAPLIPFAREVRGNTGIDYRQFDAAVVRKINLFILQESFDFEGLEAALDRILQELPAIKRIFAHPIIRLKDSGAILPVESVRVVNHTTVVHASSHSELWGNLTQEGLTPRKLLTVQSEDQYTIYENQAFVYAIDRILQFVGRNLQALTDLLYVDGNLQFNLLERLNHPEYFLAIGKLHIGYVRNYDHYRTAAGRCLDKLLFLNRVIRARLGSPIYQKCKKHKGNPVLKKTNIFRMHKDYHRIYQLLKWFADEPLQAADPAVTPSEAEEGYGLYLAMITVFAAGHFNFTFREQKIDFYRLKQLADFAGWTLMIESVDCHGHSALRLSIAKDRAYRILLVPGIDLQSCREEVESLCKAGVADEVLPVSPDGGEGTVLLHIHDVESFRRIQQILLRGMICADTKRTTCPFCGDELTSVDANGKAVWECASCRTVIRETQCPKTGLTFAETQIKQYQPGLGGGASHQRDALLYARYVESQMHFRNITPLSDAGKTICPHCGEIH